MAGMQLPEYLKGKDIEAEELETKAEKADNKTDTE